MLGDMGKQLADRQAALSMFAKLEWRAEDRTDPLALRELQLLLDGLWQALAIQSLQFRFGVEGVHLRGTTVHEQVNHVLGAWSEMGGARCQGLV